MRTLVLSTVIMAIVLLTGVQPVPAQSGDEAAVAQAVEEFRQAYLSKDLKQFEKLCADKMSFGHSSGKLENKKQFIDDVTGPRSVWKFIELSKQTIQIVGNNAIVRHIFTGENVSEGKTNPIKIGILMVWVKQDGRWKLLARQAYKV